MTRENNPWAHAPHNPCYDPSNAGVPFGKEFCPRWPSYGSSHNMSASVASRLERAARRALRPFRRGISRAQLEAALEPRCAQRLCVGVQIVNRELFVIAPRSQACGVRPSKTSSTVNYEPACRSDKRRVTPGVYGRWMSGWNPTSLVWHWLAGMNVSDCRVGVMYGDWNGPYTRQRLLPRICMTYPPCQLRCRSCCQQCTLHTVLHQLCPCTAQLGTPCRSRRPPTCTLRPSGTARTFAAPMSGPWVGPGWAWC